MILDIKNLKVSYLKPPLYAQIVQVFYNGKERGGVAHHLFKVGISITKSTIVKKSDNNNVINSRHFSSIKLLNQTNFLKLLKFYL